MSDAAEAGPPRSRPVAGIVTLSASVVATAIIGGLLVSAFAAASVLRQPPAYQSSAILLLDQPGLINGPSGEGVIVKLNDLRAKYALLMRTQKVIEGVSKRTGIPPGQVFGAASVQIPGPSLALVTTARTGDPKTAQAIAEGYADELVALVKQEQTAAKVKPADQIIMSVASPAQLGVKVAPIRKRAYEVGGIAGGLGLVGFYLLADALRAARRARR